MLPWTRLGTGSPVLLSEERGSGAWRGVISERGEKSLQIAFDQPPEIETATIRISSGRGLRARAGGGAVSRTSLRGRRRPYAEPAARGTESGGALHLEPKGYWTFFIRSTNSAGFMNPVMVRSSRTFPFESMKMTVGRP